MVFCSLLVACYLCRCVVVVKLFGFTHYSQALYFFIMMAREWLPVHGHATGQSYGCFRVPQSGGASCGAGFQPAQSRLRKWLRFHIIF